MEDKKTVTKVLIADDDPTSRRLLAVFLRRAGYEVIEAVDGAQAMQLFDESVSIAVLDLDMPKASGLDCMEFLHKNYPDLPIIFVSSAGIDEIVQLMKAGAFWFLPKPIDGSKITKIAAEALKAKNIPVNTNVSSVEPQEVEAPKEASSVPSNTFLPGTSMLIKQVNARVARLIELEENILINGESGTGKSNLARQIHLNGAKKVGPFISISCGSLPANSLASELFGYEKGSFEGAEGEKEGKIVMAENGTLFLDDIGDLPKELQPRLLEFLDKKELKKIGSNEIKKVNVRIIAASAKNLVSEVDKGNFRSELFFRLNVISISIPPVRERKEDITSVIPEILKKISQRRNVPLCTMTDEAINALMDYDWPGNIRELENVLEKASVFCSENVIDLPDLIIDEQKPAIDEQSSQLLIGGLPLDEVERRAIIETLKITDGNKAAAARKLKISERSIYNKLKRLKIEH